MSREPLAPARRYTQPAALDQFQVDLGAKLFYCLFLNSISQVFRRGQGICGAERRGSTALIFLQPSECLLQLCIAEDQKPGQHFESR